MAQGGIIAPALDHGVQPAHEGGIEGIEDVPQLLALTSQCRQDVSFVEVSRDQELDGEIDARNRCAHVIGMQGIPEAQHACIAVGHMDAGRAVTIRKGRSVDEELFPRREFEDQTGHGSGDLARGIIWPGLKAGEDGAIDFNKIGQALTPGKHVHARAADEFREVQQARLQIVGQGVSR